jgi:O-antigen ligase
LLQERFLLLMALFLVYGVLRNIFSAEPLVGWGALFGYFGHWLLPFMLGYGIVDRQFFRKSYRIFCATFVVIIFFSLLAYAGIFYRQIGDMIFVEVEHGLLLKGLRSHISLASLCLILSLLSVSQAVIRADIRRRTRLLLVVLSFFFLAALLLTGSRGYYIAAILTYSGFGVYLLFRSPHWRWFLAGGAGLLFIVALLFSASPSLRARMSRTGAGERNVSERIALYRVAIFEIKTRPLVGFGPGQGIRQKEFFNILPVEMRNVQRHPHLHSFYLNFAADFGLLGMVFLVTIIVQLLMGIWRATRSEDDFTRSFAVGLFWAFIGTMIGDCFDTLLLGPGTAMELFWLTGLVLGQRRRELSGQRKPS